MNCSDCNAPHSAEAPLTVTGAALLCPVCLELHNAAQAAADAGADVSPIIELMRQRMQTARDTERAVTKSIHSKLSIDGGKTWLDVKAMRME